MANKYQIDFLNTRSIILFICILQGVIFAGLLFFRAVKRKTQADFWLAGLLLLLCLSMITAFIGFANLYDVFPDLSYFPFGNGFAYAPVIYFYVLSLTNSTRKFKLKNLLYFIPAFVYAIYRLAIFFQDLSFKNWFDEAIQVPIIEPIIVLLELVWNIVFLYLSIRHYRTYRSWLNENFSDTEKVKFNWLRNFLYLFSALMIIFSVVDLANNFVFRLSYAQYFYFEVMRALLTYYLAVAGYLRSETIEVNFAPKRVEFETNEKEKRKTLLSDKELEELKTKLQALMIEEKPFLNPQLTLNELARKLGVNSAALSYTINTGFNVSFNDFVNEYRIDEVKAKLQNAKSSSSTLLSIAFESGFNSKATFNRAFKKFTGTSPKEFQNQD